MTLHAHMHTRTLTLCEIGGVRGGHTQLLQNIAQHTRCLWHVPVDAQLSWGKKKSEKQCTRAKDIKLTCIFHC